MDKRKIVLEIVIDEQIDSSVDIVELADRMESEARDYLSENETEHTQITSFLIKRDDYI